MAWTSDVLLHLDCKNCYLSNNASLIMVLENRTEKKVSGNDLPNNLYDIQDVKFLWFLFYSQKCRVTTFPVLQSICVRM